MKKKIKWDEKQPLGPNLRSKLPVMYNQFRSAGDAFLETSDPDTLHKFRLAAKRFRYTLELFRDAYGPGLERLLSSMKQIQNHLGIISDSATTRQLLRNGLHSVDSRIEEWLDKTMAEELERFRQYWTGTFNTAPEGRRWASYLATPGRYAGKRSSAAKTRTRRQNQRKR